MGLTCTHRDAGAHRLEAETRPEVRHAATTGEEAWSRGEKPTGAVAIGSRLRHAGREGARVVTLGVDFVRPATHCRILTRPERSLQPGLWRPLLALHARNQYPEEVPFSGKG